MKVAKNPSLNQKLFAIFHLLKQKKSLKLFQHLHKEEGEEQVKKVEKKSYHHVRQYGNRVILS